MSRTTFGIQRSFAYDTRIFSQLSHFMCSFVFCHCRHCCCCCWIFCQILRSRERLSTCTGSKELFDERKPKCVVSLSSRLKTIPSTHKLIVFPLIYIKMSQFAYDTKFWRIHTQKYRTTLRAHVYLLVFALLLRCFFPSSFSWVGRCADSTKKKKAKPQSFAGDFSFASFFFTIWQIHTYEIPKSFSSASSFECLFAKHVARFLLIIYPTLTPKCLMSSVEQAHKHKYTRRIYVHNNISLMHVSKASKRIYNQTKDTCFQKDAIYLNMNCKRKKNAGKNGKKKLQFLFSFYFVHSYICLFALNRCKQC